MPGKGTSKKTKKVQPPSSTATAVEESPSSPETKEKLQAVEQALKENLSAGLKSEAEKEEEGQQPPKLTDERLDLSNVKGIGPAIKEKLIEAGISDAMALATCPPETLVLECALDRKKAIDILENNYKYLEGEGFVSSKVMTAKDAYEHRKTLERITTGSKKLDELLKGLSGGGVETEALTEVYGEFGSGKTQLCHTLCVTVQLPKDQGGLDGTAVWIDTEGTFRGERIEQIASARNLDVGAVLDNILLYHPYNAAHMEHQVSRLPQIIFERQVKLIVVDSLIALYRSEFAGMGNLAVRQQRIGKIMKKLLDIATVYKLAVVITNQVMASPGVMFGDPTKPTGGHVLGHASTYRIYLRKAGDNRIAKMVDSPEHAYSDCKFTVDNSGVTDVKPKEKEEDDE